MDRHLCTAEEEWKQRSQNPNGEARASTSTPISFAFVLFALCLQLVQMGFPAARADEALTKFKGDENQALEWLLTQPVPVAATAAAPASSSAATAAKPNTPAKAPTPTPAGAVSPLPKQLAPAKK